ncbi:MAG: PAS domain S-box protein [Deltaproteobacteria bacterium]|nr:PAS domain S-box protein [Deltaproteobacteria bacterium]
MHHDAKPLRIAILLDEDTAARLADFLSLFRDHPDAISFHLFGTGDRPQVAGLPVQSVADFRPEQYDLILDEENLGGEVTALPAELLSRLITGPASQVVEALLLELAELLKEREIHSGILDSATDAVVTIDEDHLIVGFNRGAEQMFGFTREEAMGQVLKIIIPPPHKEMHREYVRRYVSTRQAHVIGKHVQLNAQRRDGAEFPMSISFSVTDIRGNLYFTGIVRDITEYKEMEERLVRAERLAAVGNTVSHIAHEIKNPLLIIGGFARQLLKAECLDAKERQKLNIISEEVSRLEAMLAEMRDFVRRPSPRKQRHQLEPLINEVADLFEDALREQHITLRREQSGPIPPFNFDRQQLHQVLVNLFKNAMEAMPSGGQLTLASRLKDDKVEVSLTDTGPGMTPEVQANIFQPYFTTKEKGTGLGLAICQNILAEHGGCICADSTPGQGSTFTIQIPLEEGEKG